MKPECQSWAKSWARSRAASLCSSEKWSLSLSPHPPTSLCSWLVQLTQPIHCGLGACWKSSTKHWGSPFLRIMKRNKMQPLSFNHMPPLEPQIGRICVTRMGKIMLKLPPILSQHNRDKMPCLKQQHNTQVTFNATASRKIILTWNVTFTRNLALSKVQLTCWGGKHSQFGALAPKFTRRHQQGSCGFRPVK